MGYLKKNYNVIVNNRLIIDYTLPQEFHAKNLKLASRLEIEEYSIDTQLKNGLLPILLIN